MGLGDEVKDQLSFLGGFKLTFQHLTRPRVTTPYPDEKKPKQPAPARPPRPQPLRGRHGEVHRLRAVRRRVPGRLHLRARPRQPARPPGLARGALRLRLRDQLPALHPLRHVRGGLPDRGHHRVEALRVLLHQPLRRHLHQERAAGRRPRHAAEAPVGGLARGRRHDDLGLDAGHLAVGQRGLRGRGAVVRRAGLRRPGPRRRPVGPPQRRAHRHQGAARDAREPPAGRGHPPGPPGHAGPGVAGQDRGGEEQEEDGGDPRPHEGAARLAQGGEGERRPKAKPDAAPRPSPSLRHAPPGPTSWSSRPVPP